MRNYAILQTLNARLLASKSATQTLQKWCDEHHVASPAKIRAVRDINLTKPASDDILHALDVSDDEQIEYRSVQLFYGDFVLSEADNWYVPSRLTVEMNHILNNSEIPFGVAVESLNFHRRTDEVQLLWHPNGMAENPQTTNFELFVIPDQILQHRAVLKTEHNIPFSIVIETYTKHIFDTKQ